MRTSKLSDKTKNEIVAKHNQGIKAVDLCQEYNISKSYLYKLLKQNQKRYNEYKKTDINFRDVEKMRRLIITLRTENEIFRKSNCTLISSNEEKIIAVEKLKDEYSVHTVCRVLGLLRSTYYHWLVRSPEQKWYEIRNEMLTPKILELF